MKMTEVNAIANKSSTVTFNVPSGTRSEIENAVAERLRSDAALVWNDSPEGIKSIVSIRTLCGSHGKSFT
jgi:hypothetical protein